MNRKLFSGLVVAFLVLSASAVNFTATVSSGAVRQGEWNYNFTTVKNLSEQNGIPMIAFWANPGCGWCGILEKVCVRSEIVSWLQEKKLLLAFGRGQGGENSKVYRFAQYSEMEGYPYICVYWPNTNGTTRVIKKFMGRYDSMTQWDTYTSGDYAEMTAHRFRSAVDAILADWTPRAIGESAPSGGSTSSGEKPSSGTTTGGSSQAAPKPNNDYAKRASKLSLAVVRTDDAGARTVVGVLDFATTSFGKVSAKYTSARTTRALSLTSAVWSSPDTNGTVTANLSLNAKRFSFALTAAGMLSAKATDADFPGALAVDPVKMVDSDFANYRGTYSVALVPDVPAKPVNGSCGASLFTVKLSSLSSARKGQAKIAIIYPNGKKGSMSAIMAQSEKKMPTLPVLKKAGLHTVSALLAFKAVPTEKAPNVVVNFEGVDGVYANAERTAGYETVGAVYGSLFTAGMRSQYQGLTMSCAAEGTAVGAGGGFSSVTQPRISVNTMGQIKGSTKVKLAQRTVTGKFTMGCLPGWEGELEGVKALGSVYYTDSVNGTKIVLGFPCYLQK